MKKTLFEEVRQIKSMIKRITEGEMKDETIDFYEVEKNFRFFVGDIVHETPRQSISLIEALRNNETELNLRMRFTEEVKDGRTPRFYVNAPLILKG